MIPNIKHNEIYIISGYLFKINQPMELCFFSPVLYNSYDNCFATTKLWDVQLHDNLEP